MEFVEGGEPTTEALAPNETLEGHRIEVRATRLLIQVQPDEGWTETAGGIAMPTRKSLQRMANANAGDAMDRPRSMPGADADYELELGVVVGVGQGRFNQMTGEFLGSNFAEGELVWFRRGDRYGQAIDDVPGREDLLIVQEDLVRARLVPRDGGGAA